MLDRRISRIKVRNYRSLADVDVELSDLTVFVGANGGGKSTFLDVFRFVRDALTSGLDAALISNDRGGIGSVRRYSSHGRPYDVSIAIDMSIDSRPYHYEFTLGSERKNEYRLKYEVCEIGEAKTGYTIKNGKLVKSSIGDIAVQERNLTLPLVGNIPAIAPLFQFLTQLGFYSIFPNNLRPPQRPGNPYPLTESGDNLATVLREFTKNAEVRFQKSLYADLAGIVPGVTQDNPIGVHQVGSYLVTRIKHSDDNGIFDLALESDGTIRVLGILTAIYQQPPLPLISIEEPELMIHAGALAYLCETLKEAALRSQIFITTHSPDLLASFPPEVFRVVERGIGGSTEIGVLSKHQWNTIQKNILNAGELLRVEGLRREQNH